MSESKRVASIGRFELWFLAQITFGMVYIGGAVFLIPPFTLSLPRATPGDVGIVMALMVLLGLGGPLVGGQLDRFGSFRLFQLLGMVFFAAGFAVLALVDELIGTAFAVLLLGVGGTVVLTTNMSLMAGVVGVRYIGRDKARSSLFDYIEIFYNRQRLHSSLSYLRPLAYENQYDRLPHVAQLFVH